MKKIIAILLSFILCFNFAIGVSAEEITEPYEESFVTQHHNYLMGLIQHLMDLLIKMFNLIEIEETEPPTSITVWKTPKGKKYHIDKECAGPTGIFYEVEIDSISSEEWCGICATEYKK